ncbi:MAG TPA: hypothetical protein VGG72_21060 [Bryobacteraceae bacterium]|jgi:hypothetical protein
MTRPALAILSTSIISIASFGQSTIAKPFVPLVNIPGAAASLPGGVKGIAVDSAGNVFFASGGYSVLRWDAVTGILTSVAGNGTPGFSGDNGLATSAQLDGATAVAVDGSGSLYIADSNNDLIRKVSNGIITTVAGGGAYPDCDNCPATSAYLGDLTGLAADSLGNLYIFTEGLVRKVSNGVITRFLSYATLYPDGALYTFGAAAVDSTGNLFIADPDFHVIHKVSSGAVTTVAGTGTIGFSGDSGPATSAQLTAPQGVAVDAAGDIYIADTGNQRIRKVSNGVITTVAGGGTSSGSLGDNGPATEALLNYPFGIGVDSAGNLYIEDTLDHRIRKVSNGVIATVAGGGFTPVLLARSAGRFDPSGSMSTARFGQAATLLQNGSVLIAGGYDHDYIETSELYDPATRMFTATGNMTTPMAMPTATLLPDGRVLTVGMSLLYENSATAELYDPSTGTFSTAGSLPSTFGPTTVTLLNSGKVLITGASSLTSLNTNFVADLYDPLTGTFTATGSMVWRHSFPTATLLPTGKVLIAEGICGGDFGSDAGGSELFDPTSGTFSPTVGKMSCRVESTATLLPNGKVLIAGGLGIGAEVYDPSAGTFIATGGINADGNTAALLPDASVLISGGAISSADDMDCPDESVDWGDLFDPSTGTFGSAGVMVTPRSFHTSTLLSDGTVLIAGGDFLTPNTETILSTSEIYTPPVLTPAPVLSSISGDGKGQGAIWHADTGKVASADNPAVAGAVLAMYTTSLVENGVVPPQVAIGGRLAEILYFGDAPGYPGYAQVNFRVPGDIAPGSAVPVRLTYLERPSNAVTIAIE